MKFALNLFDFLSNMLGISLLISGVYYGVVIPVREEQSQSECTANSVDELVDEDDNDSNKQLKILTLDQSSQTEIAHRQSKNSFTQTYLIETLSVGIQTDPNTDINHSTLDNNKNDESAPLESEIKFNIPAPPPLPLSPLTISDVKPKFKPCPINLQESQNASFIENTRIVKIDWDSMKSFEDLFGLKSKESVTSLNDGIERRDSGFNEDQEILTSPKSAKSVRIISDRKSYTIDLVLRQLQLTPDMVRDAVQAIDLEKIDSEAATLLLKYLPTEPEKYQLMQSDDQFAFSVPEQFLYFASISPLFKEKLQCIKFLQSYGDELGEINQQLELLDKCIYSIRSNADLFKVLIVQASNLIKVMNSGRISNQGQQHLIKICDIGKLKSVKSNQKNVNLYQFMLQILKDQDKKLFDNISSLRFLRQLYDLNDLSYKAFLSLMEQGFENTLFVRDNMKNENLTKQLDSKLSKARCEFQLFEEGLKRVQKEYAEILQEYGCWESPYQNNPCQFFQTIIELELQ